MDLEKEFGFDQGLAEGGVWVAVGENGTRLLIAAMPNMKLEKHMESITRRYRSLGSEIPESIHEEAVAKCVLLGWEGIEENGKTVEPEEVNRVAMLRRYPRFKSLVIREALNLKNFQKDEEKNS